MGSLSKILNKEDIDSLHKWIVDDSKIVMFQDQVWKLNDNLDASEKVQIKCDLRESREILERDRNKIIESLLSGYKVNVDSFVYKTQKIKDIVILAYVLFRILNERDWGSVYEDLIIQCQDRYSPDTSDYIKILNMHNHMYWSKDGLSAAIFVDLLDMSYNPKKYKKFYSKYEADTDDDFKFHGYRSEFLPAERE